MGLSDVVSGTIYSFYWLFLLYTILDLWWWRWSMSCCYFTDNYCVRTIECWIVTCPPFLPFSFDSTPHSPSAASHLKAVHVCSHATDTWHKENPHLFTWYLAPPSGHIDSQRIKSHIGIVCNGFHLPCCKCLRSFLKQLQNSVAERSTIPSSLHKNFHGRLALSQYEPCQIKDKTKRVFESKNAMCGVKHRPPAYKQERPCSTCQGVVSKRKSY